MKQCPECKNWYKDHAAAFYKNKSRPDGYDRRCVICERSRTPEKKVKKCLALEKPKIDGDGPMPLRG